MTMTIEEAKDIMASVVLKRARWGKHYSISTDSEYNGDVIMEAIALVWTDFRDGTEALAKQLTKANRQLGASKAREEKAKKKIASLETALKEARQKRAS